MVRPKIMIIGHARHGKDTVADMLQTLFGLKFTSSSFFCADKILMPAFERMGKPYASAEECFVDRHNGDNRAIWHSEINKYGHNDLARLTREIFEVSDIYVGCRNDREYLQAKAEGLFNLSIWVTRHLHVGPEPESSMKLKQWMADITIDNNGTLEQTEQNIVRVFNGNLNRQ